jgi:hypothetical protein
MTVERQRERSQMRIVAVLVALAVLAVGAAAGMPPVRISPRDPARERGAQLFHGPAPLTGRLVGHADPLPPEAVRCNNCHGHESEPATATATATATAKGLPSQPTENVGPTLGPASLTRATKRRGGPASRYTAETFCRLLRAGVDPKEIVIPQLMPRYTLNDTDCDALWNYLVLH